MRHLAISLMLATLPLSGCSSKSNEISQAFQQSCPKPDWWDEVSIERVQIDNLDQLSEYWKRKTRSARKFFKAAYQAILDHSDDQDLVVHALKWMPIADYHYPHNTEMLEFAVNRYFFYDRPLANYSGKKGDMIGGIVQELIRRYNDSERYDVTVKLVERLLSERRGDVNDHMLELISLTHAEAFHQRGMTEKAIGVLKKAVKEYDGSWEKRLRARLVDFTLAYAEALHQRGMTEKAIGVLKKAVKEYEGSWEKKLRARLVELKWR